MLSPKEHLREKLYIVFTFFFHFQEEFFYKIVKIFIYDLVILLLAFYLKIYFLINKVKFMKKKISALIVDGKRYTITDDKKFVQGRRKRRTIDEFRAKKGEITLVIPPDIDEEGAVYGFSNEKKYKEWLIEKGLYKNYEREQKMLEKARRNLLPEEKERIIKEVNEATEKFGKILKEYNLKANEIEKIAKLREDPYSGLSNSVYLYDRVDFDVGGSYIVLPGNPLCPRHYNDLSMFNFDNKTSSFAISRPCSMRVQLFRNINFTPRPGFLDSLVDRSDLGSFWFWFGVWDNAVSSVIVW